MCGRLARWTDAASGEPLCTAHYHPFKQRPMKSDEAINRDWVALRQKLTWHYGEEIARMKLTGGDAAWNADVRAWRELGR